MAVGVDFIQYTKIALTCLTLSKTCFSIITSCGQVKIYITQTSTVTRFQYHHCHTLRRPLPGCYMAHCCQNIHTSQYSWVGPSCSCTCLLRGDSCCSCTWLARWWLLVQEVQVSWLITINHPFPSKQNLLVMGGLAVSRGSTPTNTWKFALMMFCRSATWARSNLLDCVCFFRKNSHLLDIADVCVRIIQPTDEPLECSHGFHCWRVSRTKPGKGSDDLSIGILKDLPPRGLPPRGLPLPTKLPVMSALLKAWSAGRAEIFTLTSACAMACRLITRCCYPVSVTKFTSRRRSGYHLRERIKTPVSGEIVTSVAPWVTASTAWSFILVSACSCELCKWAISQCVALYSHAQATTTLISLPSEICRTFAARNVVNPSLFLCGEVDVSAAPSQWMCCQWCGKRLAAHHLVASHG